MWPESLFVALEAQLALRGGTFQALAGVRAVWPDPLKHEGAHTADQVFSSCYWRAIAQGYVVWCEAHHAFLKGVSKGRQDLLDHFGLARHFVQHDTSLAVCS